jgi:slit 3
VKIALKLIKMKFEIAFAILCLILIKFCDMCEISGEKCKCKIDSLAIEMRCSEKSSIPKILNLNEIVISQSVVNLKIIIENKIYDGINKSSIGKFLAKIKEMWMNNNRINKLESNSFQGLQNLIYFVLISNEMVDIEKNAFNGLFSLQYLYLYDNKIKCIRNETFNNLVNVNLQYLSLYNNFIEDIEKVHLKA